MSRQVGICCLLEVLLFVSSCEGLCGTGDALESCPHRAVDDLVMEHSADDGSAAAHVGLLQLKHTISTNAIEAPYNSTVCLEEILPLLADFSNPNRNCSRQCGSISRDPQQVATYAHLAANPSVRTICETGFNSGYSSANWLCSNPKAKLYSFDLEFPPSSSQVMQQYFGDRFIPIEGDSTETLSKFVRDPNAPFCDLMIADGGHFDQIPLIDLKNFAKLASKDPERSNLFIVDEVYYDRVNGCCMDVTRATEKALSEGMFDASTGFCQELVACQNRTSKPSDCEEAKKAKRYPIVGNPDQTLKSTYPEGGFCVMSFDKGFLMALNRTRE